MITAEIDALVVARADSRQGDVLARVVKGLELVARWADADVSLLDQRYGSKLEDLAFAYFHAVKTVTRAALTVHKLKREVEMDGDEEDRVQLQLQYDLLEYESKRARQMKTRLLEMGVSYTQIATINGHADAAVKYEKGQGWGRHRVYRTLGDLGLSHASHSPSDS